MTNNSKVLTVTRTFAASPQQVYAAWTDPEQFSRWYGGKEATVPVETVSLDVRIGGKWSAIMHLPHNLTMTWSGEYTEVEPPKRLAFTMTDDPSSPSGEPVTVDFAEVNGGTQMTVTQRGLDDFTQKQYDMTVMGYNSYFDALETFLAEQA